MSGLPRMLESGHGFVPVALSRISRNADSYLSALRENGSHNLEARA